MSNLGLEENVFETPRLGTTEDGKKLPDSVIEHFIKQNGMYPEQSDNGVPFIDRSGKPAKVPPIPQVME